MKWNQFSYSALAHKLTARAQVFFLHFLENLDS